MAKRSATKRIAAALKKWLASQSNPMFKSPMRFHNHIQESYETGDPDVKKRATELRRRGYKVRAAGLGEQITGMGRIKITLLNIYPGSSGDSGLDRVNPGPPGSAFRRCVRDVTAKGGAYDPKAVCAVAGRKKYGAKTFQAMAAAGKKRAHAHRGNPADAAAEVYEEFHGRPATREKVYHEPVHEHTHLADLGALTRLLIRIAGVGEYELEPKGVRAATSEQKEQDRRQIYFVGGDQRLEPALFRGFHEPWKDHVDLGTVVKIWYFTSKDFHNFEPTNYHHQFGEEGGTRPSFHYDTLSKRFYVTGGSYSVEHDGIRN